MEITIGLILVALSFAWMFSGTSPDKQPEWKSDIRHAIDMAPPIYRLNFERDWIKQPLKHRTYVGKGLKYQDHPGCYVIYIFAAGADVDWPGLDNYENVYVGQSVNVYQRVHSHFNGKGNGDVYHDIKSGKTVYARCIKCRKEDMNEMERALIRHYNATSSYNKTRGGAKTHPAT